MLNAGESDAAGVRVTDPLPAGLSYRSFSSADPNWTCSAAGATVSCDYAGSLAAGSTSTFTLTVRLASDFTGPAVNTATVSGTTTDPVPGNNASTDNSAVSTSADLSIVKTHSSTAVAGSALDYQLAVHNGGPSDVAGPVTVSDVLPAGLSYLSATGTGWSCGYAGGSRLVTCTLAAGLADGADASPISLATMVDPGTGAGIVSNTADVSSGTADPALADNSSTDPVTVGTSAAISLTKVLSSTPPVLAGTEASFVLVASNAGPSDAATVTVTDTLPANLSFDSFTGLGWSCLPSGQSVVCSRAGIPAGTSAPAITLQALVSPATPVTLPAGSTVLVNNASIDSATPGTSTDPSPVDVPVQAEADLSLLKTPKGGTVTAGATYSWDLAVHNDGPSDAAGPITVLDTLPGLPELRVGRSGLGLHRRRPPPQTVTCTLAQPLTAGADAPDLQLLVQVDSSAPAGAETNAATAGSPTPGAAGSDSATVTVSRTAQLSISKVHSGHGVVGQDLPFTLRVHNAGPSAADQVVVTDPLPAGLSYRSAAGTGWTCTADQAGTVSCTLAGAIPAGADSADLVITTAVTADAYPGVTNIAEVSSTDPDLTGTADSTSDPVTVDPSAQLQLVKQHVGSFAVGQTGSYLLTVSNSGPTATPGPVLVTDTLPAGLAYRARRRHRLELHGGRRRFWQYRALHPSGGAGGAGLDAADPDRRHHRSGLPVGVQQCHGGRGRLGRRHRFGYRAGDTTGQRWASPSG